MSKSPASLPATGTLWVIPSYTVSYVLSSVSIMLRSPKARLEALQLLAHAHEEEVVCDALYKPAPHLPEIYGHFMLLSLKHSQPERAQQDQAIVFVSEHGDLYPHHESAGLTGPSTIAEFSVLCEDAAHKARAHRNLLTASPVTEHRPEMPYDCPA